MEIDIIKHLEDFFDDVSFPMNKSQLISESHDWPLPDNVRESLSLLPEQEYSSREDVKRSLLDVPFDDGIPKKHREDYIGDVDDHMDSLVNLDEFTQMGDEEDHESV